MARLSRAVLSPSPLGALRIFAVLLLVGQLFVTATVQRPDLLNPSQIGSDPSNYLAAAQRLNAGHTLYGPLQPSDLPVPGYPEVVPAPLLSPPLIAVVWRPLALLPGPLSMDLWWLGGLLVLTELVVTFALTGNPRNVAVLIVVLCLGVPLALASSGSYPYLGYASPVSTAALSGNVNTFLVALIALTWWASSRRNAGLAGTAAALATALKLGPAVLLWWFITQRSWRAVLAFLVACVAFGVLGIVFAGPQANLDFARLTLDGVVRPTALSVPGILERLFGLPAGIAEHGTVAATVVGLAAVLALRRHPRAAFAAAIMTTIYCSPVVLEGNFALLVVVAAPWDIPRPVAADPVAGVDPA